MDRTLRFRHLLHNRIVQAAGLIAVAAPMAAACGGSVVVEDEDGTGGNGGGSTSVATNQSSSSSYSTSGTSSGNTTSTYGTTTTGSYATGTGTYATSTGTGQVCGEPQTQCIGWPYATPCPNAQDVMQYMPTDCSTDCVVWSVIDGPYPDDGACCYTVETGYCGGGRAFIVGGSAVTASVEIGRRGAGWCAATAGETEAAVIDPALRATIAEAWTRDALIEHASVASFSRFALELMAVGAPADLIEAAHRASLDEIRHARLCFALAGAYGGATLEPGSFPFGGRVEVASDLAAIAASTVLEGCVGETLASIQAAEQLARATDPAVREALAIIAEDEARHAELAWRTVAWAMQIGGAPVRDAVKAAFARAARAIPAADPRTTPAGA
jgi:hypothetical protein